MQEFPLLAAKCAPNRLSGMRLAVLDCEDHPKWADQIEIYRHAFGEGSTLDHYRVAAQGEIPDNLEDYAALLITGSRHNVDDTCDWCSALCAMIRRCLENGRPKIVGICFGHQVVAHAMGGTVGPGPRFVFGAQQIQLNQRSCAELLQLQVDQVPCSLQLIESHGDAVLQLPPNAHQLGSSDTCEHELFALSNQEGTECVALCCQSHPEFTAEVVLVRILPALLERGKLSEGMGQNSSDSLQAGLAGTLVQDSEKMRALLRHFISDHSNNRPQ